MDSAELLEMLEKMGPCGASYAKAKANRIHIEQFRKSKKALLMQESTEKTQSAKEVYAYAHSEYVELLTALKEAVEVEEKARWALERLKYRIEIWRTEQANERWQKDRV